MKGNVLPRFFSDKKLVTVLCWDTICFFLTIFVSNIPESNYPAFDEGMVICMLLATILIVMIGVIKLSNTDLSPIVKTVVILMSIGLWLAFANYMIETFFEGIKVFLKNLFSISSWSFNRLAGNTVLTLLGSIIFAGALYMLFNIVIKLKSESEN